jgi:uncharacterized delta-60 repeat protein
MGCYAKVIGALVLAFTALGASTAAAAPGDLDPSFNGTGKLTFAPGGRTTQITDVAIQPDGKIVLAGWVDQGGGNIDFLVSRLNPGGSFDQGFGSGGIKTVDFPGKGPTADTGSGVALQPDGKIVVAGTSSYTNFTNAAVVRLEPNGDPDGSFGGETTDAGAPVAGIRLLENAHGNDVALDASGRILVAGTTVGGPSTDMYVARLTSSGARDATFNSPKNDYFMTVDFGGFEDGATRMVVQPDGKIVLVGWSITNDIGVARVIPGGVLDQDFASGGKMGGFRIGSVSQANDVALEPDGRIDFAGYADTPGDMLVWRLATNGKHDDSLNGSSYALTDFGGDDAADAIALQANGKILLAGAASNDIGVLRLQPGGLPDATFGPGGKRTVSFPGAQSEAYSMALQSDGKIVLAGYAGSSAAVVRLAGDTAAAGGAPGGSGPGGTVGPNTGQTRTPRCAGKKPTIVGTAGADKLKGTKRADVIVGLGGNDKIDGLAGNDIVCGGAGNDTISGGAGNDRIAGEAGRDKVSGGAGNDKLTGGAGNDILSGGAGKDKLDGGAGKDKDSGGGGKDACAGKDSKSSC